MMICLRRVGNEIRKFQVFEFQNLRIDYAFKKFNTL